MKHGVLNAANILIHRQPVVRRRPVNRLLGPRIGEAGKVPARVHKGVERIRLALGRAGASGACGEAPGRVAQQGVPRLVESDVVREKDRQILLRNGCGAAGVAVNDRDRTSPVALTRDAPIAQSVNRCALTLTRSFHLGDRRAFALFDRKAVQKLRIEQTARSRVRLISHRETDGIRPRRQDHRHDFEAIFPSEIKVALIMGRTAEDGARAVVHQDKIGDIDRQTPARVKRMRDRHAGVKAKLFARLNVRLRRAALAALDDELGKFRTISGQSLGQRVVRRHTDEARTVKGVWTRRVDVNGFELGRGPARDLEGQPQSLAAADPVFLHQPHLVRPSIERLEPLDQIVCIVGDAQEPLG